jgi:anti-sigma regulatory factor (Ser/Thr protein kinase)
MATVAPESTRLIAFMLPSSPYSAQMARFYCRAALRYHGLGEFVNDAEIVISELATNAIMHAGGPSIGVEVTYLRDFVAVSVIVTDASPNPPVMRSPTGEAEHWRGLHIVQALSARWGWAPQQTGKAVYAILAMEG